ncbi:NMDA receptor [Brachionus plicatilis]|uniref:NMDA receptor n=1 Tax=Brachionus plicatilis TaxID=10195 RepID=A0A3M7Q9S6_BRAPC|nr:NMDA receptor [Brachionus plicatilis]
MIILFHDVSSNGKVYAEKNDQIHSQSIPNLIRAQDTDDDDCFSEKDNCLSNHVPNAQIQRKIFKLKSENMSEFSEFCKKRNELETKIYMRTEKKAINRSGYSIYQSYINFVNSVEYKLGKP